MAKHIQARGIHRIVKFITNLPYVTTSWYEIHLSWFVNSAPRHLCIGGSFLRCARYIIYADLTTRLRNRGAAPGYRATKVPIDFQYGLRLVERIKMNSANGVLQKVPALLGGP